MLDYEPVRRVLEQDKRVIFAYLFGSARDGEDFRDIDLAVFCTSDCLQRPFDFTSDLKISLYKETSLTPDIFDITIINILLDSDTAESLLILGDIFDGLLLVDKNPDLRTDIIERVSSMFLEADGLLMEVFS